MGMEALYDLNHHFTYPFNKRLNSNWQLTDALY